MRPPRPGGARSSVPCSPVPSAPVRSPSLPWASVLAGLITAACSIVWSASPALAHTSLVSSTPASSAVLVDPVQVVTLVFSQPVSPRQARVIVTGPDGTDLADGSVQVSGGMLTRSVSAWPGSGRYRLAYRVLAQDGHPITGQVPFRVTLSAPPTASTTPATTTGAARVPASASRPAGTGAAPVLLAVLSGVAVVLLVGAVRAGRRTRRRAELGP